MSEPTRLGEVMPDRTTLQRTFRRHDRRGHRGRMVDGHVVSSMMASQADAVELGPGDVEQGILLFVDEDVAQDDLEHRVSSSCLSCKGSGWLRIDVRYGHPDFGKMHPCRCKQQEIREKHQRTLRALSQRFGLVCSQRLDTFRWQIPGVQVAYQESRALIEHLTGRAAESARVSGSKSVPETPHGWLILRGPVGTGKTHLAMAIANACLDANITTLFAAIPDLLDYLRAVYDPTSPVVFDEVFTRLRDADVLVLDDFGTQRSTPWADEKLFQLLNARYNYGWPTVITMNTRAWSFLDERIRSRFQDAGLVQLADMDGAWDYWQLHGSRRALRLGREMHYDS